MMNKNMMRQAQQLQKQMAKLQEEIENSKVENSVGGGVVKVVVTGKMVVESIEIDPEVVDSEDVEMLQDLVQSAVNGAIEKAQELASTKMGALTGGLNIPGLTYYLIDFQIQDFDRWLVILEELPRLYSV